MHVTTTYTYGYLLRFIFFFRFLRGETASCLLPIHIIIIYSLFIHNKRTYPYKMKNAICVCVFWHLPTLQLAVTHNESQGTILSPETIKISCERYDTAGRAIYSVIYTVLVVNQICILLYYSIGRWVPPFDENCKRSLGEIRWKYVQHQYNII